MRAPALDEHRERILAELMSATGAYAPGEARDGAVAERLDPRAESRLI